VSNWYEGKECAYCHTPFHRLQPFDHPPALMGADRITLEWNVLKAERLPEIFRTYSPVCWNCHIAETFRRVHPELVVDRHRQVAEHVQH
jgi:hypothetical protein